MSPSIAPLPAKCQACDKSYLVPHQNRTYQCKACGGTVTAQEGQDVEDGRVPGLQGVIACQECEAINPGGMDFCIECGASLPPSKAAPGSDAAKRLRHAAGVALKRATLGFNVVTWTFHFGALAYAVATLFAVMALADPDVPWAQGVMVIGLTTLLSVLFGMGALHVHFRPFLWTALIALATTAVTVVHLYGPNPFGLALYGTAAWALLAWLLLVPTFWFQKQITQHKDLYVLHHASAATRRALRGRSAHDRHERLLLAMKRAALRAWKVSATAALCVVVASTVGTHRVLNHMRTQEFEPALQAFLDAWNGNDLERLGDLFDDSVRGVEQVRLSGLINGHGWNQDFPELRQFETKAEDEFTSVAFDVGGQVLSTRWHLIGPRWSLASFDLPRPSAEGTLQDFRQAWNSSDLKTLAGFFEDKEQHEMLKRARAAKADRGWDSLPTIQSADTLAEKSGIAVAYHLGKGTVETEWHFALDGSWRLHRLKFPER